MTSTVNNVEARPGKMLSREQQSRNRIAGFGSVSETPHAIDHVKTSSRPIGTGLGNGSSTWMTGGSGSIWADSAYSANGKNGRSDPNQTQAAGYSNTAARDINPSSRSIIATTDLDNAAPRHNPWSSRDETTNLGSISGSRSRASPDQRQSSLAYPPSAFTDSTEANSMFPFNKTSSLAPSRPSHTDKMRFDPTIEDFEVQDILHNGHSQQSKMNANEDVSYAARGDRFPPDLGQSLADNALRNKGGSGYDSGIASRTNSLPPSRGDINLASSSPHELSFLPPGRSGSNGLNFPNGSQSFLMPNRPSHLGTKEQASNSRLENLAGQFDDLTVQDFQRKPSQPALPFSHNSASSPFPSLRTLTGSSEFCQSWDEEYATTNEQLSPTGSSSSFARQQFRAGADGSYVDSPLDIETRISHQSPYYSANGTPPTLGHNHPSNRSTLPGMATPAILDRRLRGLQQQQQQVLPPHHHHHHHHHNHNLASYRNHMGLPFDVTGQQSFLHPYYQMNPPRHVFGNAQMSRGAARDADPASQNRNPLLEEFKNSTKTNKRWELKDIYGSIVDFSGDQHGSRFVQQKLETANSDEKEQIFREILHDAYQLMTDIFGNYVIQKFFEHGNQVQKKTLAMQMKNRVFSLSLQTYGCRVVQKALEHVLTDQQAELVKELSADVMKCVQDQNGNHVIQMAIQRVPAEHIDFIVNAFHRRVYENARNAYGCRVIQRMLEHCEEPTKQAVMQELHQCASSLIPDQYGNYVTQHIIQHGSLEDRTRIINLVIAHLVDYSRHKFASNVVEKSIEFGTRDERVSIVRQLTAMNERGDSAVLGLIRDQYGNYVVQKLLTQLQGQEWVDFAEPVKIQVALLRRIAYGKQVASVEKLLCRGSVPSHFHTSGLVTPTMESSTVPTPALTSDLSQSPQSTSQPSTNANSVDAPHEPVKPVGESLQIYAGPN